MPREDFRRVPGRLPLWRLRAVARAPRLIALAACVILAALGVRALLVEEPPERRTDAGSAMRDLAVEAFAEAFTRTYLTWDAEAIDERARALERYAPRADAFALDSVPRRPQSVAWTAVVADTAVGGRRRRVTVTAETSTAIVHLAVTVGRDGRGSLFVELPPAIVGQPPVATTAQQRPEDEVDDAELRSVAARVVKNYLAREREDLAADLAPRAVASLPAMPMRAASVDGVTWVDEGRRRVAVTVTAAGRDGLRLALRYELAVTRRAGRWLVRTVHVNPAANGGS